jgi:uridylate kinase
LNKRTLKKFKNKHIMLKLSGEALMGDKDFGIDLDTINSITNQISVILKNGVKISIVVGGGNIFRGISASSEGMDRSSADYTGMMATVINSLILQNSLEQKGVPTRVLSAIKMDTVCESYIRRRAIRHIEKKRIVIFAAGTGNPFFTTDTAAALRASEMKCDVLFKATKVDGIYNKDPKIDKNAKKLYDLNYDYVINNNLRIMDTASISLAKENKIPILVFSILEKDSLINIIKGSGSYTIIK